MIIRVLPHLNTQQSWIDLCRREQAYCFVEQPETLVDMQSTYLQITLLDRKVRNGREAIKYSLGSRTSIEPAWQLIKSCNWQLDVIIAGLEQLDFSSNVRDNSLLRGHSDLTVRKFFAKERELLSPSLIGLTKPLLHEPETWSPDHLIRLLAHRQFRHFRLAGASVKTSELDSQINQLILDIDENPDSWMGIQDNQFLYLLQDKEPVASLIPDFTPPAPKLKNSTPLLT